jgi:hypothetical protein
VFTFDHVEQGEQIGLLLVTICVVDCHTMRTCVGLEKGGLQYMAVMDVQVPWKTSVRYH